MNYSKVMQALSELQKSLREQARSRDLPVGFRLELSAEAKGIGRAIARLRTLATDLDRQPAFIKRRAVAALMERLGLSHTADEKAIQDWYGEFVIRPNDATPKRRRRNTEPVAHSGGDLSDRKGVCESGKLATSR